MEREEIMSSSDEALSSPECFRSSFPGLMEYDDSDQKKGKKGSRKRGKSYRKKKGSGVMLEGEIHGVLEEDKERKGFGRTKSLTDDDLEELKGCLDLGFGFSYDEIPELCNTLPALELCYSLSQRFMDEQQKQSGSGMDSSGSPHSCLTSAGGSPIASWRISSPGDSPEEVKARLKYWAQAVACTVKLCS